MRPLFDAMRRHAERAGDAPAVADPDRALNRAAWFSEIAALASELRSAPPAVGILARNGTEWATAQLAGAMAGRTVVPLPTFFSERQLGQIVRDADVGLILTDHRCPALAAGSGIAARPILPRGPAPAMIEPAEGFAQIIYTSGSTGEPKGVRLGAEQIAWSAAALGRAAAADESDRYLSVLPLPMLLETICAVFAPALLGASVRFEPELAERAGRGMAGDLARSFRSHRPTMSVLVPQMLAALVADLSASKERAPDSLRFVAVGGAAVPPGLADEGWRLGVPVHEGYGLTECCSVVAVNRPGERRPGTAGRPLDGLMVSIAGGEIVVEGTSVMEGYLGRTAHAGPWRTGDIGTLDDDGFLTVHGRSDNVIVTGYGRNVSPEWIEALLLGDPCIALCAVVGIGAAYLTALIIPSRSGACWFGKASPEAVQALIDRCCATAPRYARPRRNLVISADAAHVAGLLMPGGRWRRAAVERFVAERMAPAPSLS